MAREICDLYELDGVDVDDFRIETERMVVYGHLKNEKSICHKCGSSHVIFNGFRNREFRLPSTGSKTAVLIIKAHRNAWILILRMLSVFLLMESVFPKGINT